MSKFKKKIEAHKHYWLADNHQHHKGDEVIFKLSYPRVFIRYRLDEAYFASFDDFFGNIAEVQWIDGEIPDKKTQEQIFIEAWNFLCIEEQIMEDELNEMEDVI
jgi:hypothetical protein